MPPVSGRRRATRAVVVGTIVATVLSAALAAAPAGGAPAAHATLKMLSQSDEVVGTGSFDLSVAVEEPVPDAGLGVRLTLYSALPNRTYFDYSLSGAELPSVSCLSQSAVLPLSNSSDGLGATMVVPVEDAAAPDGCASASTGFDLDCSGGSACSGVYPVEVALVNSADDQVVDSFTTHLVELGSTLDLHKLEVGLILPIGTSVAIGPAGKSTLRRAQIRSLSATVSAITDAARVHLTVALYPQLLDSLQRSDAAGVRLERRLVDLVRDRWDDHNLEPLATPYEPLDESQLAAAGLGGTLTAQLAAGASALSSPQRLGRAPATDPYLVTDPLDAAGNELLAQNCANELVLPPGSMGETVLTQTAPMLVSPSAACKEGVGHTDATEAFVADSSGALLSGSGSNAVLAAHQFLAELAQIYFEQPAATPRAVVVVAPSDVDPTLLSTVLSGLSGSPILQSQTLGALFSTVNVGADANSGELSLPRSDPAPALPSSEVQKARQALAALGSLVPGDHTLLATAAQAVQFGESSGVAANRRSAYLGEPEQAIRSIAASLSFVGTRNFTLTASSGKIAITINQGGLGLDLDLLVRLSSSELILPASSASQRVDLDAKDYALQNLKVETRGSAFSHLYVDVMTPYGHQLLLHGAYVIRSTAVSGVAIALSIAALAVLLGWWLRSVRRHRRQRRSAALAAAP